ncbi:MAG: AbrB/MazE/SpoVT family DNA-binding domain-containing protein [Thermoplasmata archaeon]
MTKLTIRRIGNSLAVPLPRALARSLGLAGGDVLNVELERVPELLQLVGSLKGRITAHDFTRLSNEGEDLG